MPPESTSRTELARRLVGREMPRGQPEAVRVAGQEVFARLDRYLSRTIGPDGYRALLTRALSRAKERNGALASVHVGKETDEWLAGLDQSVDVFGGGAALEGVIELLSELMDLLGQFVGPQLATRLVIAAWPPETNDARDDSKERNG